MNIYTTKDLSPIHPGTEKPTKVGWYVSYDKKTIERLHKHPYEIGYLYLWWWDGKVWMTSDGPEGFESAFQNDPWFGLKCNAV